MKVVDGPISRVFDALMILTFTMILKLFAIVTLSPVFLFPAIFVAVFGIWVGRIYMKAQMPIKREMSNAKAPILAQYATSLVSLSNIHLTAFQLRSSYARIECVINLLLFKIMKTDLSSASIRAYGAQQAFMDEAMKRQDKYTRSSRSFFNLNRWVDVRINTIGALFAAALAVYLVYFRNMSASNVGFSLNMAVGFTKYIFYWVRYFNHFEVNGN